MSSCLMKNCGFPVTVKNNGKPSKFCYRHYTKTYQKNAEIDDFVQCRNRVENAKSAKDLEVYVNKIPLNLMKSALINSLQFLDNTQMHELALAVCPINELLVTDLLQAMLDFCEFATVKLVCKEWKMLTEKNINNIRKNAHIYDEFLAKCMPFHAVQTALISSETETENDLDLDLNVDLNVDAEGDVIGPFGSIEKSWEWFYSKYRNWMKKKYPNPQIRKEMYRQCVPPMPYFSRFLLQNGNHNYNTLFEPTTWKMFCADENEGELVGEGNDVVLYVEQDKEDGFGMYFDERAIYFKNIVFDCSRKGYAGYLEHGFLVLDYSCSSVIFQNCFFTERCGNCPILIREKDVNIKIFGCIFENNDPKVVHSFTQYPKKFVQICGSRYSKFPVYFDAPYY